MKKEKPKDQGIINKTMPIGMKIVVIGGTRAHRNKAREQASSARP